jgi:hypothetical protein
MEFAPIHFTHSADEAEQFLQRSVTVEETWVNHAMSENKKKASMMRKHPSSPPAKI